MSLAVVVLSSVLVGSELRRQCVERAVPPGWITVDRRWYAGRCGVGSPSRANVRVLQRYDGLPVTSVLDVCVDAPVPDGWVVLEHRWRALSGCRADGTPRRANQKRIVRRR